MNSAVLQLKRASLRSRRRALRLSLLSLATRSGLSLGRLSLLERELERPDDVEQARFEEILGPGVEYAGLLAAPSSMRAMTFRGSAPQTQADWIRLAALLTD